MPEKITKEDLKKLYQKKVDFIDHSLTLFDNDIEKLQKELLNFLITGVISELETEQGLILLNEKNARILATFDKEMQTFKEQFANSVFKKLGENMIKTTGYTSAYFRKMTSAKTIKNIENKIKAITAITGVEPGGKIVKGGFIDKLATGEAVKTDISNLIRRSIEQQTDYKTLVNQLKETVVGSKDVNGAYVKYVGGYAHDAFFAQSQQQDNFFADYMGLDYAIYEGTEIKTSRPFCVGGYDKVADRDLPELLNTVIARKDFNKFDGMDWEGKIPGVDFINQRGGYQCRHHLRWITKELAEQMNYKPIL